MRSIGRISAVLAAGVLLGAALARGTTIVLSPTAACANGPVLLGQIATVEGADAEESERLGQVMVVAKPTLPTTVTSQDVLFAVLSVEGPEAARGVEMSGAARCAVGLVADVATATRHADAGGDGGSAAAGSDAVAMATATANKEIHDENNAASAADDPTLGDPTAANAAGGTLAQQIIDLIVSNANVGRENLKIGFDTQAPELATAAPEGTHWKIRTLSQETVGSLQFDCTLSGATKVARRLRITTSVQKKLTIFTAKHDLMRNSILTASDFGASVRWIDRPMGSPVTSIDGVLGMQVFERNIPIGDAIDARDLRAVDLVNPNDLVNLYCISHGLTLKVSARSKDAGKMHDLIWLTAEVSAADASKGIKGETFQGRVIGPETAVVGDQLTADEEATLKELR
jgi:flagella basal body P-ring formation protein FlgA